MSQTKSDQKPVVLSLTIRDEQALYMSYMRFLKYGGLFLPTDKTYTMGDEVLMSLSLPGAEQKFPIQGKVAWITPTNNPQKKSGIGVAFSDTEASTRVRHHIDSLLQEISTSKATHTL